MKMTERITAERHLESIPEAVRPIVQAARATVRACAPEAEEVVYQSSRPRSKSTMWKLFRYRAGGADVAGLGTFERHSTLFFHRGAELADPDRLLAGGGRESRFLTLRSADEARSPAVERLVRAAFAQSSPGRANR